MCLSRARVCCTRLDTRLAASGPDAEPDAWFGQCWRASVTSSRMPRSGRATRRLPCLARWRWPAGQLLVGFFTLGEQWDLHTRELMCFVGWLNVAALGNLLPAPGT